MTTSSSPVPTPSRSTPSADAASIADGRIMRGQPVMTRMHGSIWQS